MNRIASSGLATVGMGGGVRGEISQDSAGALSVVAREEAELKAAIVLAAQFKRAEESARARIIASCTRPRFAEKALYSFPRGTSKIMGPSVHLAREMARCWGNIRYGIRVVSEDDERIHIRGYAYDLETNTLVEVEDKFAKLIQRRRKGGTTTWVKPDERDLRELVNRRGAICERNAVLKIMPPDLVEQAVVQSIRTSSGESVGSEAEHRERIAKMTQAFAALGVSVDQLRGYVQGELASMGSAKLAELRAVYQSVIDGNSRIEEYFGPVSKADAVEPVAAADRVVGAVDQAVEAKKSPEAPAEAVPEAGSAPVKAAVPGDGVDWVQVAESDGPDVATDSGSAEASEVAAEVPVQAMTVAELKSAKIGSSAMLMASLRTITPTVEGQRWDVYQGVHGVSILLPEEFDGSQDFASMDADLVFPCIEVVRIGRRKAFRADSVRAVSTGI